VLDADGFDPSIYTAALAGAGETSLACRKRRICDATHVQGGFNVATTQEALQIGTVMPSLTVDDLQKSIKFYEALGFTIDERWEDNDALLGVMMRAGKTQFGLNQDDWKKGRDRTKGVGVRFFMTTTQNVDEIASRAKSAGITLKSEPHDTEWKTRAFEVTDPTGFLLTISSEPAA
jgi:uncharacterized glyoxalase superfamily protein PhnB